MGLNILIHSYATYARLGKLYVQILKSQEIPLETPLYLRVRFNASLRFSPRDYLHPYQINGLVNS